MINAFIKYLFSTCILLLSSHSFLNAHTTQTYTSIGTVQNSPTSMIASIASDRGKENDELNALFVDDDDDESISFKKHLESSHYVTTSISFTQKPGVFSTTVNKYYPSYNPSCRYIKFQTFRI